MREVLLTLFKITVAFILIMYELGVMHMLMNRVMKIQKAPRWWIT
jgi:hypothetical protein